MPKRKRRLTPDEIKILYNIMENSTERQKPSVRMLAKHFGVNRISIIKSLGEWKGIHRKIIDPNTQIFPKIPIAGPKEAASIEPHTVDLGEEFEEKING